MYLLFECGICSSLYQVQVEKFSNSLQKVVCPSCQSFHYFGAAQDTSGTEVPSIEKVFNKNAKIPAIDSKFEERSIHQELYWRCGVCESGYHFNLDRVTSQGIKVTCSTCFSFFILQKVGVMVDLDHMVMHEVSPDKILSSQLPPDERGIPPEIDINEVSGKVNMHQLQEEMAKISTNEIQPQMTDEPTRAESSYNRPESSRPKIPPKPFPKESSQPKVAPKPFPNESSQPKIPPKANPYIQPQSTTRINTQPSVTISDKPVEIKPNDVAWVNSFKSFNTQRREFKLPPEAEISSVMFLEHNPKREKNIIEKNLSKISMWIAGICIFCLAVVFAYDWYLTRQEEKNPKPVEPAPVQRETILPDGSPKPQYGFPVLEE